MIEQKIEALLFEKFKEEDFSDCFLVEVKLHTNNTNTLKVFIDSDSGLAISKCQKISRYLEGRIDDEKWLGEIYTLEVSSPGLENPLLLVRQYQKNIGRTLLVNMKEGTKRQGVLVLVTENSFTLEEEIVKREKKKKIKELVRTEIPFDAIEKAKVKISFKAPEKK